MIFLCDIDYNSRTDVFRDVISLITKQCEPQATEGSLRRTKCPPAAQRKQAKRACKQLIINKLVYPTFRLFFVIFLSLD